MTVLKHKLHKEIWLSVSPQVISYKYFMNRVFCTKDIEKMNNPDHIRKLASTPVAKKDCKVDQEWRECTICRDYKKRSDYYTWYGICKLCFQKNYSNKKT